MALLEVHRPQMSNPCGHWRGRQIAPAAACRWRGARPELARCNEVKVPCGSTGMDP